MSSYRLLYIQPVGEEGGMETTLLNEIRQLDRARFAPIMACLEDGPIVNDLRALGAEVHVVPRGRVRNVPRTILTVVRILQLIKQRKVSLVISQNPYAHIFGQPAAAVARRPTIVRIGGIALPDRADRTAFALGACAFTANSRFTSRALVAAGVAPERVRMVYPGVRQSDFEARAIGAGLRSELGLPMDALVVTTLGRLQHGKGQHVAVAAVARVVRRFPHTRLLIAGEALFGIETEYPKKLRSLVQKLGLDEHVMMLGHRRDVPAILAVSDVVLVPSITPEGFGMVTVEAMAAARPVVATDAGASSEIVTHGITGLLVPPNDPNALADALIHLLENGELRHTMGARAQEIVRERFTLERAVSEYEHLYLECLQGQQFAG